MNEQDLEVLITLDDPWYGPDVDRFHDTNIDNSDDARLSDGGDPPLHQYF